jgi:ATP-dependent helicase HrpB
MPSMVHTALPIDVHVDSIVDALRRDRFAVVVAPPGSGKTTRIPPALTAIGRTILLQPRRVAARALARRIAHEQRWTIGREIGWQIRFERRFSADTRLLVATEGILTARLQGDPLLSDFGVVVLDEFHERSIHADLALALVKEAAASRDDLCVVVMSATMDASAVAAYLDREVTPLPAGEGGRAPERSEGARPGEGRGKPRVRIFDVAAPRYPIDTRYRPGWTVAEAVREALPTATGDILCFLPGVREIERARGELSAVDAVVLPLHGTLHVDEQERAITPAARRKVILATNVAETSLTVEGVTDVIDSGTHKILRFDASTGVDHLLTERISLDSADQRAGRAGRTRPGRATRLWDERDILRPHREPEVRRVDLAGTLLDIIAWGGDPETFDWFERPPQERIDAALDLLLMLGAIELGASTAVAQTRVSVPHTLGSCGTDTPVCAPGRASERSEEARPGEGSASRAKPRVTKLGDDIRRLPLHPRLARLVIEARGAGVAVAIAAALSEGIRLTSSATTRSDAFALADAAPPHIVRELSAAARHVLGSRLSQHVDDFAVLTAILAAYPDRVARRREPRSERLLLSSGTGATLARESGVREGEFLVALELAGSGSGEALVRMASFVERDWLTPTHREKIHLLAGGRVRAVERSWYGAILLHEQSVPADPEESRHILAREMRSQIDAQLANRVAFAGIEVDWDTVLEHAAAAHKRANDPDLLAFFPFDLRRKLDQLAPATCPLPSGRTARLEYRGDGTLFAAVKLQELFGLGETPAIGPKKTPITFELLAPNGRPVQVTRDLRNFWNKTYAEVRKELRARYPKHPWPEDPWSATPTHRTRRR